MNNQLGESIHFRPSRAASEKLKELSKKEKVSQADIMRRVLDTFLNGESKSSTVVINSTLGDRVDLSLFLGATHHLREHWRDVRSRVNLPRPIRPDDDAEMEEWKTQKEKINNYFSYCEDTKKRLEKLSVFFSGLTQIDYENLKKLGVLTARAKASLEQKKTGETDPEVIRSFDANIIYFEIVLNWLTALGIEHAR